MQSRNVGKVTACEENSKRKAGFFSFEHGKEFLVLVALVDGINDPVLRCIDSGLINICEPTVRHICRAVPCVNLLEISLF